MKKEMTKENILEAAESWHNYDYKCLIYDVLSRLDDPDKADEDTVWEEADSTIIYNEDMWIILKEWCTPIEANWELAYEAFETDCIQVLKKLR